MQTAGVLCFGHLWLGEQIHEHPRRKCDVIHILPGVRKAWYQRTWNLLGSRARMGELGLGKGNSGLGAMGWRGRNFWRRVAQLASLRK